MSVKDNVLKILSDNKGIYFSGEDIAKELNVSRNSVWKAVKSLNNDGYAIKGISNKGYCLEEDNDVLAKEIIEKYLDENIKDKIDITVYKTIDSTNTRLKQLASEGACEWKVLISEEQTAGKGRLNRTFYSPEKCGIYMSILLKPEFVSTEALFITTMAAVAVAEAIESVVGVETKIKWVNDIYCNNKKVCGILTEAAMNLENGKLDYAVLGIGINVKKPKEDYPDEIKEIATGIIDNEEKKYDDLRCKIAAQVINNVKKYYMNLQEHKFMDKYKEKSLLVGSYVYIRDDENREELLVKGIDDNAGLIVEHKDGRTDILSSGEVSVKLMN